MSTRGRDPARRDAKEGFCPPGGSEAPCTSYVSGLAGRPTSTAAMAPCWTVRASLRELAERDTQQRHGDERVGMNEDEAARIAARLKEVEEKLTRLEEMARRVAEKGSATSSGR
ncbi:hypothetical protein ACFWZ2_22750 [Streptomyces sp. NPDC059002]|uniref:hypothetical protein n=1 Tax=Streptomyces sp. NPDC059002 TaxID=3346690 RepID=UPI00369DA777